LAAALLSLSTLDPDPKIASNWRSQAQAIAKSLWENYSSRGSSEPCILIHGARSKPHNLVDHGLIYGDYYFFESLLRLAAKDD
jgi:hypothetical protein